MITLARSEKSLADSGEGWDTNGWLLGVANGVIDLRTGKLRDGKPDDRITLHIDIAFDHQAKCPRWERFLAEIFNGDSDLISYIQRAIGYSLTGETSEQCFFCCNGEGGNGKSTFLNAFRYVFGDYGSNLPFSAFELAARATIPNDVATLPGRRFVTAIETDESARLNEARIKALTGGDFITARLLYREFFTFKPVAKFWLAFNHQPIVVDDSHGFWRRVHQIPFVRRFDPQAEPKLEETLRTEASGILTWAVRGCLLWQEKGLEVPPAVAAATAAYQAQSDHLGEFMNACIVADPSSSVPSSRLWRQYLAWVTENEEVPLSRKAFAARMQARGYRRARCGHQGTRIWQGIRLAADVLTHADGRFAEFYKERPM